MDWREGTAMKNSKKRPNIIFYFTDQQRWDTCGCYGQPLDITPTLDVLASEGIKYENAFTAQPVCGPCRAIFQTGKYATQLGCYRNNIALPFGKVKTIAEYFNENGYETAYIGKWHLASSGGEESVLEEDYAKKPIPKERRGGYNGFWRASDVLEFTSHGYDGYVFNEKNEKCEFTGYRADCILDFGLEFLEQYRGDKPFFMTISQIEPHHQNDRNTYEGPVGSKEKYSNFLLPKDLEVLGGNAVEMYPDYLGQCRSLDDNLKRLVDKLKEKAIYDNTVIVFASDHGSHFKTRNNDAHKNGYDDYKRSSHSACSHVPLIIGGGAIKKHDAVKEMVSTLSLPKTFLALAGIDVCDDMHGENLLDIARGVTNEREDEVFIQVSESRVGRAIRTQKYHYAVYAPGKNGWDDMSSDVYSDDCLYDIEKDPYELNNIIEDKEYEVIKTALRKKLIKLMIKAGEKEPYFI